MGQDLKSEHKGTTGFEFSKHKKTKSDSKFDSLRRYYGEVFWY